MNTEEETRVIEDTGEVVKEETNEVMQKPKVKKPRSEAQIKAFEVARQKLADKRRINKENKEKELAVKVKEKELAKKKVEEVNEKFDKLVINEEEDEAPVVIQKPKTTRKKKQPKIILEDESSDSDSEIIIRRRRGKTQRAQKKHHPEPIEPLAGEVEEPVPETYEPVEYNYTPKQLLRAFGL